MLHATWLQSTALAVSINDPLFSFLVFWRVDRDACGNAILVRDGPPARNALSANGSAYLKEWHLRYDGHEMSTLYYEGCVAITAQDYVWFLSDAQIPELEDFSEEDVEQDVDETEDDSEEDVEFEACAHSSCST